VAPDESTARNPLGAVGGYVIENIRLLREERRLAYTELSALLSEGGRPIPTLGLSRIEKGKRRVDVDDLVAIAAALGVNPSALLLPRRGDADQLAELTPTRRYKLRALWGWADGAVPLPTRPDGAVAWREIVDFVAHARPEREISGVSPDDLLRMATKYGYTGDPADPQPVAAAIVTSPLGVLVGRRADGKPPWTFIAGEIEPGEQPADAAVREVKEETGLEVTAGAVIGQRVHPATRRMMTYLAARPVRGTEIFVGDEAELTAVRWVSLAEADELLAGMFEPVREHLVRELGGA
jgi:8-oxo-dGTP pyrophosphatase MutT (NUDIX family)/transcriptional regulator with XRE-family HTH domain